MHILFYKKDAMTWYRRSEQEDCSALDRRETIHFVCLLKPRGPLESLGSGNVGRIQF